MKKLNGCATAAALAVTVALVSSVAAQAGKVSGSLVVNGKKIPVQHVSAVTYDTASQGRMISVLVSDKPPDPKTFREYTRIGPGERYVPGMVTGAWVAMHADDKAFSGFHFTIDGKRRAMLSEVLVGGRNNNFGILEDYLVVEITSVTPRVVGRLRTKDAVTDLGSTKVGIDLTFDAPVVEVGK
jgi:hypothetical protein